jgi:hypothetical protein
MFLSAVAAGAPSLEEVMMHIQGLQSAGKTMRTQR